jgi:hypothetical protein
LAFAYEKGIAMQIENMTRFVMNDEEVSALYEVCASALENNLMDGMPMAFALAIVETLQEPDEEGIQVEEVEQVTLN